MNEHLIRYLKIGVWLYFYLLIFEGALRKWVLPGLAEPLLLIRDPLAILIIFLALRYHIWKPNLYVVLMWGITVLAFSLTFLVGHGNLLVAIYGLRITAFHFPLIFIFGCVLNKEDVIKIGKHMLWLTIGMSVLVALQFYSPQTAWVNRGIGGEDEGSGFWGTAEFFRVPGTFAFTTGLSLFYGMAAAFIFYFWVSGHNEIISKKIIWLASLALIAAIPLSISRTVLFEVCLSFAFLILTVGRNPRIIKPITNVVIAAGIFFLILSNFSFFQTATMAFTERFTTANKIEGGVVEGVLLNRLVGGMFGALVDSDVTFGGVGMGMGSSFGAKVLTGNGGVYLVSEAEWGRLIGEFGLILGGVFILIRVILVLELLKKAWSAVKKENLLPWMLMSFGMMAILQGQWYQTNTLGFGILIGGLVIASLKQ